MFVWSYADKGKAVTIIADIKRSWDILPNIRLFYDSPPGYNFVELSLRFLRFKFELSVEWWKKEK